MDGPTEVLLPASPRAPALARQLLRQVGSDWSATSLEVVLLVVTEAVTNAVRHGGGPVGLTVRMTGERVRVEVTDTNPELPRRRDHSEDLCDGGRGLHLLDALTHAWGVQASADGAGKIVWLEVDAQQPPDGG